MSEDTPSAPVLSEDEKDALLEGVESGEVEVQSTGGPLYASVNEFEVTPRNRIVTNSFPRLKGINNKLAGHIAKGTSQILNQKVDAAAGPLTVCTWGEFREQAAEIALIYEFVPAPLDGNAAVFMQSAFVGHIVETFYGGSKENPPHQGADGFTPGEMNVAALLCADILRGITATWGGLIELAPEKKAIHQSTDIVEIVENSETVIAAEFDVHFADEQFYFHLVWPTSTLAPLLPVLEGQKRDRDAVEDARWAKAIRDRLPEAQVNINTQVGRNRLPLRDIAALKAGDIIDLDNPRAGTVYANSVPVLAGRFGVHDGHYALETTHWLTDLGSADTASTTN
ncbi:MAG: FliM/FliN family flagellar motor switch protein [Pseudomonadota bacterium]